MQFSVIMADPPWSFKTYSDKGKGRSPDKHYSVMDLDRIKKLPVNNIGYDSSVLLLWATSPMMPQAFSVMQAWGFEYKTVGFVWIKTNKISTNTLFWGLGYYTRANAEYCLLGVKGKGLERVSKAVHQVIVSPIGVHSEKPAEIYTRIDELFGTKTRKLELFGRKIVPGWMVLGNEVTGNDIRSDLEKICKI